MKNLLKPLIVKLSKTSRRNSLISSVIAIGIAVVGYTLFTTSAANLFASLEVEDGTLFGGAAAVNDEAASGGRAVQFASMTNSDPDPVPNPAGGPFLPYSANSFFRMPLPANAPIDSKSAEGINFLKTFPEQQQSKYPDFPVINGVDGNKWGTVYFQGTCSDPVWKLKGNVRSEIGFLETEGFHAPARLGQIFTGTSDSPFVVMDTCGVPSMPGGLSVWAANAAAVGNNVISVSAAGVFQHDSNGLDKRNPRSDSNKNFRSRGAIPDSMVIRKDRLEWGIANDTGLGYVLHMFFVETDSSAGFVHPMVGDESDKHGFGAEGMRIRIKPGVDLGSRGLSPAGLVIARTLQTHGAYIGDNSGSGTTLKAAQDYGQWGDLLHRDALRGLTWDDFEFVQRGYQP